MFNFKRKPQKKLEDLRIEYNALNKQHKRNIEAKHLEGKIFAMKHPMLANLGQASQGKGRKGFDVDAIFKGIDKRMGGL